MEEKWIAIAVCGMMAFAVGVPLSVEKWQEGQTERAKIHLEIAKIQASGNIRE